MNIFLLIFFTLCMGHMSFRLENMIWPSAISKVMLIPSLLVFYLSIKTDTGFFTLLLGTAGDAFLLAGHKGKLFYAGMLCFFVGHLSYITYFVLHLQSWGYFLFVILVLAFPLYKVILSFFPSKDAQLLSIYSTILSILTAFCASVLSFIAMLGSLFFAVSDYLIAMDIIEKRTFS